MIIVSASQFHIFSVIVKTLPMVCSQLYNESIRLQVWCVPTSVLTADVVPIQGEGGLDPFLTLTLAGFMMMEPVLVIHL